MCENLEKLKKFSDRNFQKTIGELNSRILTCNLVEIRQEIDLMVDIIKSKESSYNDKMRFGTPLYLSLAVLKYPHTISDFVSKTIKDPDLLLSLMNGVIDYETCYENKSLFRNVAVIDVSYSKLDLFFLLLFNAFECDFKPFYQLIVLVKRGWEIFEKALSENLFTMEFKIINKIVRFFTPLLDSNIGGLSAIISNLFEMIIKWALCYEKKCDAASKTVHLFSHEILDEFFSIFESNQKSSYPLCKINLRFLKIIIHGFGIDLILDKLPLLFEFIFQTISINHTASISGDIFAAILKTISQPKNKEYLFGLINRFMNGGFDELWFETGSRELQTLNFTLYALPFCVRYCFEEMLIINNNLFEKLNESYEHRLFMWLTCFTFIYPEHKTINSEQFSVIYKCLYHKNDHIRIAAYKFICDNYPTLSCESIAWNLSHVIEFLVNNLTSDNPAFRNYMMSATKRLFVFIRDSAVPHLSNTEDLMRDISYGIEKLKHLDNENVLHLESIIWSQEISPLDHVKYKDLAVFIGFCRFVYRNQWFNVSINYQRQRSVVDLIMIIREVLIDSNFFIDKRCGFSKKTVLNLRNFYRQLNDKFMNHGQTVIKTFINAINISKSDVQNSLYSLLVSTYFDSCDEVKTSVDLDYLWAQTKCLCHSNQPIQLNAGSLFCSFLVQCNYKVDDSTDIVEYLINYLEHVAYLDMGSVLQTSLKTPGYGFLLSIDCLLKQTSFTHPVLKSERVAMAAVKVIKLMMQFMGCEDNDLASFQKMGVQMNSIALKDSDSQSVKMNVECQHVLSWTWQVLKNTSNILISWCQAVVSEIQSPIFHDIGVVLLRVLCQSRHKGTIECVGSCLQTYIQLGEKYGNKQHWLSARKVAIDECIEGAVKGQYSITRRSAGFPLILLSALVGSLGTPLGSSLASECLTQIMNLCNDETGNGHTGWCDPPIVHYLNLMRQICQHPALEPKLQCHFGDVILITLANFSSPIWGVRNAALQLFTAMLSRVASATKGPSSSPTFSEFFSLYPQLWKPIILIIQDGISHEKCFLKNQTLVPTLTLLSILQYSHDKLFPEGISINEILSKLWPLLGSGVVTVRKLAAKCIINCLPYSYSSSNVIIQSHTRLIPLLTKPASSLPEELSNISSNQQHGELILFQYLLNNFCDNNHHNSLSMNSLMHYTDNLFKRRCWILLDSVISLLLTTDISVFNATELQIFCVNLFIKVVDLSLPGIDIGRLNLVSSVIKLMSRLPNIPDSIAISLLNFNKSDILQQICFDCDISKVCQSDFSIFFKGSLEPLITSLESSLTHYQSDYSPYLIQIFRTVITNYPAISFPNKLHYKTVIKQLRDAVNSLVLSESVTVLCQEILSWVYSKEDTFDNQSHLQDWINRIIKSANFHSVENSRISSAKNIERIISSRFFEEIISYQPLDLSIVLTFGCFDECKSIRDEFRLILNLIIGRDSGTHFRHYHLIELYRIIGERSKVNRSQILINIWKVLIDDQRNFFYLLQENKIKDALYEPVPPNIYIEHTFILELIFNDLRQIDVPQNSLTDLLLLHPDEISSETDTSSGAFVLSLSKSLLKRLILF